MSSNENSIVVIGSCSVDFTTYAPRLPLAGETLLGSKFTTSFGGKGANQAVAAAKLAGKVKMICRLGDDHWGNLYKDNLKKVGVDTSYVFVSPESKTGIAQITVAQNGENQIVIVPGANEDLSIEDVVKTKILIANANVLIGQLEIPFDTTLEAFKINKGIKIFNAAPAKCDILPILPYCTILCVNETEASIFTSMSVDLSNSAQALRKLLETGCETAIITLGENGAVYASIKDKKPIHVLCKKVTPVDTTGAGDAFVGALGTFLLNNKDKAMHQIIGAACSIASLSVTKEGTQTSYPTIEDAFIKQYEYKEI